jgi:glycine cleavage system transcriptional repressor
MEECSMPHIALVSILGPDRVGLVAAIADHLFSVGVNLRDTTFAALGKGAEFTALCELPGSLTIEELEHGLVAVEALAEVQIRVVPCAFDHQAGPMDLITHRIEVSGGDQLGLIARLSEIFAQYGANIVRMNAQKRPESEGGRYVTRFAVSLPPAQAEKCLAAVTNTAGELRLTSRIETAG